MKLIKKTGGQWEYELQLKEAEVLRALLANYPFTKLKPVKMAKGGHDEESFEREMLLNESLAQHRNELKKAAEKLTKECLGEKLGVWLLKLKPENKEILLQILNDTRIGAWRELGEPEDIHQEPDSPAKLRLWTIMNLTGYFEEYLVTT
jgi:hypothetical protein